MVNALLQEKLEILAKQLAERIIMNWEFQLPTSFQDKSKAEELLAVIQKGLRYADSKTKKR